MKKGDWVGLGSVVIIVALGGLLFFYAQYEASRALIFAPQEVPGSALVVQDVQENAILTSGTFGVPSFITVHTKVGDAPGPLVGVSSLLEQGIQTNITVQTTEALTPNASYVLLMIADDGDGVYEAGVDRPVMVNGQVIRVPIAL